MFKKILVPIDPTEAGFAKDAIEMAGKFAKDYGSKIHLVAVCQEVQTFVASQLPQGFQDQEIQDTQNALDGVTAKFGLAEGMVDSQVRVGSVYHEVLEEAAASGCDLILMTSHKPGLSTYFIGSNAAHIVRHAPCSVTVLR
ncbi:universal stress protein [Roseibium algae]|uniref:Universal stress protein n=1 Tax=Roseibium algae TaxID=3123038 RepID=A0ABU8TKY7_9HYPH